MTEPLDVSIGGGVATVTIDHPPINLFDLELMTAFDALGQRLADDDAVRVVVVRSADPDFFIAHADVSLILGLPTDTPAEASTELGFFHAMVDRFRTMPKITIGVLEGIARGGGSELFSSFDLRYATPEAVLGQPEVPLGIIPGGSGTQRLGQLVGRARALEIVASGDDIDAPTAEAWGWVNRVIDAETIGSWVGALAKRIAANPHGAVADVKASVDAGLADPVPGLLAENDTFARRLGDPEAIRRMERFLELGGQTREVERDELSDLIAALPTLATPDDT